MACKIILTAILGASALDTMAPARVRAKARLREALNSADDRVSDPKVVAAVEALALYNPTECEVISDDRLGVKFTGGYLCPDGEDCEVWNSTFEAAFENYKPRKRDRLMNWLHAPTATPKNHVVVFSANEDAAAARCVDVFLRQDGSYGFDEFRRDDGQGWTPTLPDFYSREKFATAAEARAEARAAIPWFEAWEEGADVLEPSKLSEEEIPCCSEMKYCGASPAALNVAAVMGFNYAYDAFPTC